MKVQQSKDVSDRRGDVGKRRRKRLKRRKKETRRRRRSVLYILWLCAAPLDKNIPARK